MSNAQIKEGWLDLRSEESFEQPIYLDGEWRFFWGELLSPLEIDSNQLHDYFHFPSTWGDQVTRNGTLIDNIGAATYQLKILLPNSYPNLAIYIKHVYSAGDLYVNDQLVDFGGSTGLDKESNDPRWIPKIIEVPRKSDTLILTLQVANYEHSKGGAREQIVLQAEELVEASYRELMAYDLLLGGALVMTGLFFLGLFFMGSREIPALPFALFCFTFAYRIVAADDYTLQIIYPEMNWLLSLKLEYLSLFLPPLFLALYTHQLFTFNYKINPFHVFAWISGLFALITLVFPPIVFTYLVEVYLSFILLGIVVAGYTYYKAYQLKLNGSKWAMISSLIVFGIFGYEIFIYLGALIQVEAITFIAYTAFFFFQSITLFLLFTASLRKAKEEAEHASRTKTEFLSMMSHEIRTPMNAVIGLTNFLIEDKPKHDHKESLNTLKFSAENLLVIINDILDFSKIEAQKIELDYQAIAIRQLVKRLEQIFLPLAENKHLKLHIKVDSAIPEMVECDQTRLSQVLTNLLGNAIKFTENGHISLKLEQVEWVGETARVRFTVSDTGIGIDSERQKVIFESFTQANSSITRKFGGTGLGLTITKRLLELQGASLELDSAEGIGSTFWFELDLKVVQKTDETTLKIPIVDPEAIQGKVLLVEDNEVNVMVASKFLKKWGAQVEVAENGQRALEILAENSFDVILMDLQMPIMDGFTASRKIREKGQNIPIIALTASVLIEDRRKIYEAGMNDFVMKPFDPAQLQAKILHYCK